MDISHTQHFSGEELAQVYCGSCHEFPKPDLLGKRQWEYGVLPAMSARLGIGDIAQKTYSQMEFTEIQRIVEAGIFPSNPLMDSVAWEKLCTYYITQAPDTLERVSISYQAQSPFTWNTLFKLPHERSMITMLHWDEQEQLLWSSDETLMRRFTPEGKQVDSLILEYPLVDIVPDSHSHLLLSIGIIHPQDQQLGYIARWTPSQGLHKIQEKLERPVKLIPVNAENLSSSQWVLAEYGNYLGKISVLPSLNTSPDKWQILSSLPGACDIKIKDMNEDGFNDLIVLMAQGDEKIVMFSGNENGKFEEKILLRFPAVYGSNGIEVLDFDSDGDYDILYTHGDNADYSPVIKPYHGIRLYENVGKNTFKEKWFIPVPGISRIVSNDFDLDGDLDFAAISFFPDYESAPASGFTYLENVSTPHHIKFDYHILPQGSQGRWMVMQHGDPDQDGDIDLWLGSFTFAPTPVPPQLQKLWYETGINIVFLENQTINF